MRTLLIIDMQNDFMPQGPLPVPGGDEIIELINGLAERFELRVASQDWHPADHKSFAQNHEHGKVGQVIQVAGLHQILWPAHCVQKSLGAELVEGLRKDLVEHVIQKGTDPEVDSYSAFYDNGHRKKTPLSDLLRWKGVSKVHIAGVATDYCVKFTALDARKEGFEVVLIKDACRGVELTKGDVAAALDQMAKAGIKLAESKEL